MDIANLLSMGAKLIQNNSDSATTGLDTNAITSALSGLLGGSDGNIDIAGLVSNLSSSGGLSSIVGSWLGTGDNESISADSITDLFGADKISAFASNLGLSEDSAKGALADAVPNMINEATSDGLSLDSLLENVGGAEGAMAMLGKMFK